MSILEQLDELVMSGDISIQGRYSDSSYPVESWDELKYELDSDGIQTPLGRLFKEAEYGGMDQGSEYWLIVGLETSEGTRLFKKDGWYASHVGSELDGALFEVESFERTITDYRRV